MWRKLFSLLVLSMMATASADCPSGQCMTGVGCMDNSCAEHVHCQQLWGQSSTCSNGECVNSCTIASAPQYTCAEVATEYTTNCGTCGNTTPETASGLEKPATLTEEEKLTKVKQWICDNRGPLSTALISGQWNYITSTGCGYSVNSFFGSRRYQYTPLDL